MHSLFLFFLTQHIQFHAVSNKENFSLLLHCIMQALSCHGDPKYII